MKPAKQYDAVVVGAGPAGSTAARRLGQAGLRVLLLERKKVVGAGVQCAEFVPVIISQYTSLREGHIAQRIKGINTYVSGQLASCLKAPGYVLNRAPWEQAQAEAAEQAGVLVSRGARVTGIARNVVTIASGDRLWTAAADYILGCDGPRSLVSAAIGNEQQELCIALQYELALEKPTAYAAIYFEPAYYGGYAWVFPKGATANVGLAVHSTYKDKLRLLLTAFCRKLAEEKIVQEKPFLSVTGGPIPAGGLVNRLESDHMLLAGDAAGCTHPITGAGIMNAVVSGHLAARAVITNASSQGAQPLAENYTRAIKDQYGRQFAIACERLQRRTEEWTDNRAEFLALIRRSWIAFPEYYA